MNYQGDIAQSLVDEILDVIHNYDEAVILPTVLGCLDLVKLQLLQDQMEEDDEDD